VRALQDDADDRRSTRFAVAPAAAAEHTRHGTLSDPDLCAPAIVRSSPVPLTPALCSR
jgi:hypothetical protein